MLLPYAVALGIAAVNARVILVRIRDRAFVYAMSFWFHLVLLLLCGAALAGGPWLADPGTCAGRDQPSDVLRRLAFLFSIILYAQDAIVHALKPADMRRSDFWVMAAHHAVTIPLIMWSCSVGGDTGCTGLVVLFAHEPADVVISAMKYADVRGKHLARNALFGLLVVVWPATRIGYFGGVCMTEWVRMLLSRDFSAASWMCTAGAYALVAMHVYWYGIMWHSAVAGCRRGRLRDLREPEEIHE
jgi:hypothetical protein